MKKNRAISRTITLLAKQFNILVTAEGVETKEQLDILKKMDVIKPKAIILANQFLKRNLKNYWIKNLGI